MSGPRRLYRKVESPALAAQPCALAIGTFDGVHQGHQLVVEMAVEQARRLGIRARVLTFYPRPVDYFDPSGASPALMNWREKVSALLALQLDDVVCVPFGRRIASLTAALFIDEMLVGQLAARHICVGSDFRFGADRAGDVQLLAEHAQAGGFGVEVAATREVGGERISSTRIRDALQQGNLQAASSMLGRPYSLCGRVIAGNQLGRQLGAPTANIDMRRNRLCVAGVYVARVWLHEVKRYWPAVANIGHRPAVDARPRPLLEVHLLGYSGNLYGRQLEVELLDKLRDEKGFASLQDLQAQIAVDRDQASAWHQSAREYAVTG